MSIKFLRTRDEEGWWWLTEIITKKKVKKNQTAAESRQQRQQHHERRHEAPRQEKNLATDRSALSNLTSHSPPRRRKSIPGSRPLPPRCRDRGPRVEGRSARPCDWLAPWGKWLSLLRVGWFPIHGDASIMIPSIGFAAVIWQQTPHFCSLFFSSREEGRAAPVVSFGSVVGARRLGISDV